MSLEAEQMLRPELGRSERLLWSGVPDQGLRFRRSDLIMIPFSLMWGGFAFFWEYSVVSSKGAPLFFMLWGVPFVLAGLYIIVGRFFLDRLQRGRTYYGVTNQRIIIVSGLVSRQIKNVSLRGLNDISLDELADGSGSITFGPSSPMFAMWSGTSWPGSAGKMAPTFEFIKQVRKVYTLVRDAQRAEQERRDT